MNVEIATEAAQFLFWEYINRNFFAVKDKKDVKQRNNIFICKKGCLKFKTTHPKNR